MIQLVFTIVPAASGRSLSAVIVIGVIFTVPPGVLYNLARKNSEKPHNATNPPLMDAAHMHCVSNIIASDKEKK